MFVWRPDHLFKPPKPLHGALCSNIERKMVMFGAILYRRINRIGPSHN